MNYNLLGDLLGLGPVQQSPNQVYQNALANMQQQSLAQHMALQSRLANYASQRSDNVTPIRKERTPEEIQAQLEARMAELEAEAKRRERFCTNCQHCVQLRCTNRLVIGFGKPEFVGPNDEWMNATSLELCGPEKALFTPREPRPSIWQRFTEWLARIIERAEGRAIQQGDK